MNSSSPSAGLGRKSIFLLGRSLDVGGAERQMVQLAIGLQARGHKVTVGLFYRGGALESGLVEHGFPIVDLRKRSRWDVAGFLFRLARALRAVRPDVVYSFLGTANTVAAAVRPFVLRFRLLWSIRASNMDLSHYDWVSRLGYRLECALSRLPDLVISNSAAGVEYAVANGFPRDLIVVVPNGIDIGRFRPDRGLRQETRRQWGLGEGEVAVGMLARIDPVKDHATFLRAAALVAEKRRDIRFVCIGDGPENYRRSLQALVEAAGIADRVLWPGAASDPVPALNAFDIACSSAETEGFSNAVAEAMACGRPCVVTDVGDSAMMIADTGYVVPAKDPAALAGALTLAVAQLGSDKGRRARERIVNEFSISKMVDRTVACF